MRLLDLLRSVKRNHHHVNLTSECRKDIKWWRAFMPHFNGISIIYTSSWSSPDEVFATDACLTGCGGCSGSRMFHKEFPVDVLVRFPFIHQLECLPILVAVRLWGLCLEGPAPHCILQQQSRGSSAEFRQNAGPPSQKAINSFLTKFFLGSA